ncbi:hypothetical protein ABW20_dc0110715 [Dactylellina cionopaga]|nr:hypothetical protein ABW20_dc0110715 [Dactylellina cionopaga]
MVSKTSQRPNFREFRPAPVIGGIITGLAGLGLVIAIAYFIDKRLQRRKATEKLKAETGDVESLSDITYIDDKDSDTLYSPTENSPALGHMKEKAAVRMENLNLAGTEDATVLEKCSLPPPFPAYKGIALGNDFH